MRIGGIANLKSGTQRNPVIIAHLAPSEVSFFQNRERMIVGQKVAAIPDHPKMMIQKTPFSLS